MHPPVLKNDRAAGIFFLALGVVGLWLGRDLPFGTLISIGSGFVPTLVFAGLLIIGAIKLAMSFARDSEPTELSLPRPLLLVAAAFIVFGLLIERGGLVIAISAMLVMVEFAGRHAKSVRSVLLLIVGLTVFSVVVFRYVLGIPLEIFPQWN